MKIVLTKKRHEDFNIWDYFLTITNALCVIGFFIDYKIGIASAIVTFIMVMWRFDYKLLLSEPAFIIYIFANIFSGIAYIWNDRPFDLYFVGLESYFVPSLLIYAGMLSKKHKQDERLSVRVLDSYLFMMIVGTVTYFFFNDFYFNNVGESLDLYTSGLRDYRYGSYIASIALGAACTIAIPLYFHCLDTLKIWKKLLYLPIIILNTILCMQRGAWITCIAAVILCLFARFKDDKKMRKRVIFLSVALVIFLYFLWQFRYYFLPEAQVEYFLDRIGETDLRAMGNQRSYQWINALKIFISNPIGEGVGALGQKAARYGLNVINDGNHLRILAETGILGFAGFLYMNFKAAKRFFHAKKYYFLIAIIVFNLQAIGSPVMDSYFCSYAYWLIIGYGLKENELNS